MSLQVTYPIIGYSSYSYNGREGFYLNCIENYQSDDKSNSGSFQTGISANYEELHKLKGVPMSLEKPAIITFKGRVQNRGGVPTLLCDEIISIYSSDELLAVQQQSKSTSQNTANQQSTTKQDSKP